MTRRATKPQAKSAATLRAKAVLPWGFVARSVEDRAGYTPSLAPRPRAKRLLANCVLSNGLVSNTMKIMRVHTVLFSIVLACSSGNIHRCRAVESTILRANSKLELLHTRQVALNSGLTEGPAVAPDGSIY